MQVPLSQSRCAVKKKAEEKEMNGSTYSQIDSERLRYQRERIASQADGIFRTLEEWAAISQGSEAGTSARIRELANSYGYLKQRKHIEGGLYVYSLLPPVALTFDKNGQGAFL